jgi:hypothetical protein
MSRPLSDYPVYEPLTKDELRGRLADFFGLFQMYADALRIDLADIQCNEDNVMEIVERVDKRKVYFRVFYGKEMSERNEAALYCFWILKLAPFYNTANKNRRINVSFAAFLFLRMVSYICVKENHAAAITRRYLVDLLYAFAYRDLSKEAIMAIAETFLT